MSNPRVLGVEIGGTKLQLGIGPGDGRLDALVHREISPELGAERIRAQIVEAYAELQDQAKGDRAAAAAIGFGGPVNSRTGRTLSSNQVDGWSDFPICEWLSGAIGVRPVSLFNDSDTATLAEARFGSGRSASPLLYVNSGSGVGGGLVVNGRMYVGSGAGAIEIGHLWVEEEPDSRTLEQVASGWAIASAGRLCLSGGAADRRLNRDSILRRLVEGDPSRVTCALVADAAMAGDPDCLAIFARATRAMGRALAHAVTLLSPRRIALGGGVAQSPRSLWLDPIAAELDRRVFQSLRGSYEVVSAELGQAVVVHGALALAADSWRMLSSG